jgi:glutaredoxin
MFKQSSFYTMAKVSTGEIVSLITLAVVLVLLVLLVLSLTGTMSLCGGKKAGAKRQMPPTVTIPLPAAGPVAPKQAAAVPAGAAAQESLLSMEGPEAVKAVRASGRDRVLYVLGQNSCPACVACKEYLASHGAGDAAVFVDLNKHGAMLKDGSLPQGVPQSLGRGVPCLVAYSHRSGAVMKKSEGFSPKVADEMVKMVRG